MAATQQRDETEPNGRGSLPLEDGVVVVEPPVHERPDRGARWRKQQGPAADAVLMLARIPAVELHVRESDEGADPGADPHAITF